MTASDEQVPFGGVEPGILDKVIALLRTHHKDAAAAVVYYERHATTYCIIGISNLRDVLSHISSALAADKTYPQRLADITSAEEHMRRAIIESYQAAVDKRIKEFDTRYEAYKTEYVRYEHELRLLSLNRHDELIAKRSMVLDWYEQGRNIKPNNWDSVWETSVNNFSRGIDLLTDMFAELGSWEAEASQKVFAWETAQRQKRLSWRHSWVGWIVGAIGVVVAVVALIAGC